MKIPWIFPFLFLCFPFANAQTIKEASYLFENFEYQKAAVAFESIRKEGELKPTSLEKLARCYLYTYNSSKGLPVSQELIQFDSKKVDYWLWKATFEKGERKFDEAINSANKYISLGGENLPLLFIESCQLWLKSNDVMEGELKNSTENSERANFTIFTGGEQLYFDELELDSIGELNDNSKMLSEVFLLRPFYIENSIKKEWKLFLFEDYEYSVNSIQIDTIRNKVYFSAAKPRQNYSGENKPILYTADYEGINFPVKNMKPWIYSGLEDSSSCAHVALSSDGSTLVFSKISSTTRGSDLFVSKWNNDQWSAPKELARLNSDGNEMFPVFSGDSAFYFSSDGRIGYGNLDLYRCSDPKNLNNSEITHLNLPINSQADDFLYSPNDKNGAYFVSNRAGGKGDDDVWEFKPKPIMHEEVVTTTPPFDMDAFLEMANKSKEHFEFDEITPMNIFPFIEQLKSLINEGHQFKIEVLGFADSRGSAAYNNKLGLKRAQAVIEQLADAGIDRKIMSPKSFGKNSPENNCGDQPCSEEEHAQNRFVRLHITVIE